MKIEEIIELINEAKELSYESLEDSKNKYKKSISEKDLENYSNEHLCIVIASNRYLKINPEMELLSMKELAKRRSNGDSYLFEEKIDEYSQKFLPIETNIPEIFSMFSQVFNGSTKL